ncbi:MAG: hypothetical protein OXC57_08910 [Rhodobacteraceae bacterium]|nr:hypothetical protein [Paracoccaceae bacterium]
MPLNIVRQIAWVWINPQQRLFTIKVSRHNRKPWPKLMYDAGNEAFIDILHHSDCRAIQREPLMFEGLGVHLRKRHCL